MKRWRQIDTVGAAVTALLIIVGCTVPPTAERSTSPIPTKSLPTPSARDDGEPANNAPIGWIEHATGPTDVVLRFDNLPDHGLGELDGESFHPGPEFTLYGDGTVIFRDELAQPPPAEGPFIRGAMDLLAICRLEEPRTVD